MILVYKVYADIHGGSNIVKRQ